MTLHSRLPFLVRVVRTVIQNIAMAGEGASQLAVACWVSFLVVST